MEEKSRAGWERHNESRQNIDYASFGVKVLSDEEIRSLYPNATIDRTPFSEDHKLWLAMRNQKANRSEKFKSLRKIKEVLDVVIGEE